MSETVHAITTKVGVLVGTEAVEHGTEAASIDIIPGQSAVFAEAVNENKIEVYDPAAGQSLQCVVPGAKDVGGTLNFFLVDWRWLYWAMGTDSMDEVEIGTVVGVPTDADTMTGGTSGASAPVDGVSGTTLTLGTITGSFQHGEALSFAPSSATAVLVAFIHDLSWGDTLPSLTIENIFDDLSESEKYLGMRIADATLTSSRGELITVDLNFVGLTNPAADTSPGTRTATAKCSWVWNNGSIVINGVNYDNVCDNLTMTIVRNSVARGGHNRDAHQVVPGTRKFDLAFEMDLPSSALRVLREQNTAVTVALSFINVASDEQAVITLTSVYVTEDSRDTSRDAETVRVSASAVTGAGTARIFDSIFDYDVAEV
jgi:hypothetical protein